jgi:hypothetical protein
MELDLATARGGQHRLLRRGWLAYAMWIFAPLGLALVVAAITALPGPETSTPYAGGPASKLPPPPVPTPAGVSPPSGGVAEAPAPAGSSPTQTPSATGHNTPVTTTVFDLPVAAPTGAPSSLTPTTPAATPPVTTTPVTTTPVSFRPVVLEAEAGVLGSQLATEQFPGASGGTVVTGLGKNSHRTLTLPGVTVATTGYYRVDLAYAATEQVALEVQTPAGGVMVDCPATGDAVNWCATTVPMTAGPNAISVEGGQNNTDTALDLVIVG